MWQYSESRSRSDASRALCFFDLAMPPNVDPDTASLAGVTLHGIEQMRTEAERNRQLRARDIDHCEKMVEHQLLILRRRLLDRALSPAARSIHRELRQVADRALQHAISKELAHLDATDHTAVQQLLDNLVKRLVQVPLRGLKAAAWHHSSAVLDNFIRGIEEDTVPEDIKNPLPHAQQGADDG